MLTGVLMSTSVCVLHSTEGVAYTFGEAGGTITFTYPASQRGDTMQDVLALGFITTQEDAVLVRVESTGFGDYIEMEMVRLV